MFSIVDFGNKKCPIFPILGISGAFLEKGSATFLCLLDSDFI